MKLLFRYLPAQRKAIAAALLFTAVNQIFLMADPYIFRRIVDDFVGNYRNLSPSELLLGVGFWVVVMMASIMIAWIGKTLLLDHLNRAAHSISAAMFADGVRHSLELPYLEFEQRRSGETLDRLQRLRSTVERFVVTLVNLAFAPAVRVFFVIGYAMTVYWAIGVCLLLMTPLLGWASLALSRKIKEIDEQLLQHKAMQAGSATETLRNIEVVKSLGLARQEISRLHRSTDRILNFELEKGRRVRRLTFYHGAAVHACRGVLLVFAIYVLFRGHMTVGQFLALYLYSTFLFTPLQELSQVATDYRETEVSLNRFRDLLDVPVERRSPDCVELGAVQKLEFEDVEFRYPSVDRPAIRQVSFGVTRGETVAFVGPSGSGKTTLIKLISGLYAPASGQVLYNGISHGRVDMNSMRQRIGLVTQETQLFAGTIRDNLLFANPDANDQECLVALQHAAADGLMERCIDGLDTVIGEGGVRLSGGEKQRLAIARALLRRPDLLIFDEATSSLDSITEKEISDTMRDAARTARAITVLIAHRLSTVLHADRIYILNHGTIVQSGTHAELMETEGLYRDLWLRQVGGDAGREVCV
ncbi:MAG: ABC transporter ATP-binding protein/permease [Acidobacteriia bacterium]|nr:ABC transporter ATP-binding protein/permease [Terriglobia bacterium]